MLAKAIAPQLHGRRKKIGQHSGAAITLGTVTLKYLAGEKQCYAWNFYEIKPTAGKHTINVLDTRVVDRELRIHYMALIRTGPRIAAASS